MWCRRVSENSRPTLGSDNGFSPSLCVWQVLKILEVTWPNVVLDRWAHRIKTPLNRLDTWQRFLWHHKLTDNTVLRSQNNCLMVCLYAAAQLGVMHAKSTQLPILAGQKQITSNLLPTVMVLQVHPPWFLSYPWEWMALPLARVISQLLHKLDQKSACHPQTIYHAVLLPQSSPLLYVARTWSWELGVVAPWLSEPHPPRCLLGWYKYIATRDWNNTQQNSM